jgi:TctA family transporter
MMNIPGASGSAATMVDGFPMAKRGEGARALSAAITTSTVNGLLWGVLVFAFLPFYGQAVLHIAIPEILALLILAMVCVVFVNSEYWFRGIIALGIGILVGLIGQNESGAERFTFGWYYLRDGVQIMPVLAGILAIPELLESYRVKIEFLKIKSRHIWGQIRQGFIDSWIHRWDGLRGGAVGGVFGMLPGVGGNIVDWLSYGQTVAFNKHEKIPFGTGNVKGVIGCEGANNAQKATAYVPTVLFGIPAAPFEAIIMSLFVMVGLELGTPSLLNDTKFFDVLFGSYLWALGLTFVIAMFFIRWATLITLIPFKYYFWILFALILWSCVQYTGYWEDYVMFAICCAAGIGMRYLKLSRAAFIIGFVLAHRIENSFIQYSSLYGLTDILTRPISGITILVTVCALVYGLFYHQGEVKYV